MGETARVAEILSATIGVSLPIDTQMIRTGLDQNRRVSSRKIQELGYTFLPAEQTIFDSLKWINNEYQLSKEEKLERLKPFIPAYLKE